MANDERGQPALIHTVIHDSKRVMNAEERRLLQERVQWRSPVTLRNTVKWAAIWGAGFVACIALIASALQLGEQLGPLLAAIPGAVAFVCFLAFVMVVTSHPRWARYERDWSKNRLPKLKAALDDGSVNVRSVHATAVIEVEGDEDVGNWHIFDVGDGKLLFLQGADPVDDAMPWPNDDFEIVHTARGQVWVGVFCRGRQLEVVRTIKAHELNDPIGWHHDELIEGELNVFADSLMHIDAKATKHPLD